MNRKSLSMKKKILFIINPVAGTKRKDRIFSMISKHIGENIFEFYVENTKRKGHATDAAREGTNKGTNIIVAVGGDGTVNEVACALAGSNTTLGIIPLGSGDGLARHLNIPLNISNAIKCINNLNAVTIDVCRLNDKMFFCAAGVGFDAIVISKFSKKKNRGLLQYLFTSALEFFKYKPQTYKIEADGKEIERKAFLITVANASQYGNNAYIAPNANIADGKADICIIKPFPLYAAPFLVLRLFRKTLYKSKYYETIQASRITLKSENEMCFHYDGEPGGFSEIINIELKERNLKVIAPQI